MADTTWIPAEYLDEITPEPRARPEDFVKRKGDGWVLLDGTEPAEPLEPGDHWVSVYWWSDSIPFQFLVEDGAPRFVKVEAAGHG